MSTKASPKNPPHHGHNVRRLRELLNKKQELLADEIGVTQSTMSKIERQERINSVTLEKIAKSLEIPVDAIKNLNDENAVHIINNAFTDFKDNAIGSGGNGTVSGTQHNQEFPVDKFLEIYDHIMAEKEDRASLLAEIDVLKKKLAGKE